MQLAFLNVATNDDAKTHASLTLFEIAATRSPYNQALSLVYNSGKFLPHFSIHSVIVAN